MISQQSSYKSDDGVEHLYRYWHAAGNTRAIIFLHRGHEHSGRIESLVDKIQLSDTSCFAYDLRGHGKNGRRHAPFNTDTLIKDLESFFTVIMDEYNFKDEQIWIIANSLSSVIACAWTLDYAHNIRGLILAAPAFKIRLYVPFALPLLRLACSFLPNLQIKSYVSSRMLTHDEHEARQYDKDPLITRNVSAKLLIDLFTTARRVIQCAEFFHVPLLVLSAEKDWVVSNKSQKSFFSRLRHSPAGIHSHFKKISHSYHAVLYEKNSEESFEPIRHFIQNSPSDSNRKTPVHQQLKVGELSIWESIVFGLQKLSMSTLGRILSQGIHLGHETGYSSGETLDYVYKNEPHGFSLLGRALDRSYLNAIGWRGVRERRILLQNMLIHQIQDRLASKGDVTVLDLACGGGKYIFHALSNFKGKPVKVFLMDRELETIEYSKEIARTLGILDQITFHVGNIYEPSTWPKIDLLDIAITSGIYELCTDLKKISDSISAVHKMISDHGTLIYTNQPWHPELRMIAATLHHRRGEPWEMNYRPQYLMDSIVKEAGFQKQKTQVCLQGIFTVSMANKM